MELPVAQNLGIYEARRVGTLAVYTCVYTVGMERERERNSLACILEIKTGQMLTEKTNHSNFQVQDISRPLAANASGTYVIATSNI
ncbi:hypothetical protein B4U84_28730 [Westiellopsis prolifica IICB1]|nr:hypothetical protein B4U84_28730 [Westiellopsis prolifica IICB1]